MTKNLPYSVIKKLYFKVTDFILDSYFAYLLTFMKTRYPDVLEQSFSAINRTFSKNLYLIPVETTILPIISILHTNIL